MVNTYDIIIAGGGLSGLTAAILFSKDYKVLVIDPDDYPRHRLCGEYLSREVIPILKSMDIDLESLSDIQIANLELTTQGHQIIRTALPLGGIGISRYALDQALYMKARKQADFLKDKVLDVGLDQQFYHVTTSEKQFQCHLFLMCTGKRSLLDKNLERPFMQRKSPWLAVKRHYQYKMPNDLVALHNFEGGYAGLSKVENGNVNLCYLVNYKSFKKYKSIELFQEKVMMKNPSLKAFFYESQALWETPISISQISFESKQPVEKEIPMLGDAAGLIHPLCGNGMAMAIHSAELSFKHLSPFLNKTISKKQALKGYEKEWKKLFSRRLHTGSYLQQILLHPSYSKYAYSLLHRFPRLLTFIIRNTHGNNL